MVSGVRWPEYVRHCGGACGRQIRRDSSGSVATARPTAVLSAGRPEFPLGLPDPGLPSLPGAEERKGERFIQNAPHKMHWLHNVPPFLRIASLPQLRQRQPETFYLLTGLPLEMANSQRLLRLNGDYWGIGNRVRWVWDVALSQDHRRLRKGSLARLQAAFANLAISILLLLGMTTMKRRMRRLHLDPNLAVALLVG